MKGNNLCPSTSNGIESNNRVIKDNHTFRERWPMGRFLSKSKEIVESWSFERNPDDNINAKVFHFVPVIETKLWRSAYEYVKVKILNMQKMKIN